MRVALGRCPCCKVGLEIEIVLSRNEADADSSTRMKSARLQAAEILPAGITDVARQALLNDKKRYGNSKSKISNLKSEIPAVPNHRSRNSTDIDREDGQDE